MASTDARPVPLKNIAFRVTFPILDNTGLPVTGAAGLDPEVSKDAGTFADCTNEATEIATNSGVYYLDLTSTEMNADCVAVIVKTSTTDAKTTVLVFYPSEAGDIKVDVENWKGATAPAMTGDAFARLGAPAGASVSADIADLPTNAELATALGTADDAVLAQVALVKAKTDLIPSDPADQSDLAALVDALPTANENADALLARSINGGASTGRIVKDALKAMRNKVDVSSGSTMDVYEADDTTLAWQLDITTDAAALPIKTIG
jgi:hypothetical protein